MPASGQCHFYDLLGASERVGRELTKEFYVRYADMREDAFEHLCQANPEVPPSDLLASTQKPTLAFALFLGSFAFLFVLAYVGARVRIARARVRIARARPHGDAPAGGTA